MYSISIGDIGEFVPLSREEEHVLAERLLVLLLAVV